MRSAGDFNYYLILRAIVGSQAYGTSTPQSDIDHKGIYSQSTNDLISFNYKEQIEISKDETLYEVRRFLQLVQSANPTVLELLYSPTDCIVEKSLAYDILVRERDKFLTKQCANSFGGYAIAQIKKATALDKKMNWEASRVTRKTVLDFCYVYEDGKTISLNAFLKREKMEQGNCGLVALNHINNSYALYYDYSKHYENARGKMSDLGYSGIVHENSNEVRLSSVTKEAKPVCFMHWNKDGWSRHCKDFHQYQVWLEERNEQRYVDNQHGQKVDGKNLMHCRRLLDVALEIASQKTINVRRPNADYLLKIRRGEVPLNEIIEQAENDIQDLDQMFANSDLPSEVNRDFVNDLLLEIRKTVNL